MAAVTISIAASGDDGYVRRNSNPYPPASGAANSLTSTFLVPEKSFYTPNYFVLVAFVRFDTSVIPDDATILSASLDMRASGIDGTADSRNLNFEWYAWTTLSDADWTASVATTAGVETVAEYSGTSDTPVSIPLSNPDANINKTGFTGIRFGVDGGSPAGVNNVYFASWDHATQVEPRLVVDYELPPVFRFDNSQFPKPKLRRVAA